MKFNKIEWIPFHNNIFKYKINQISLFIIKVIKVNNKNLEKGK
jgi:hypothetical protein